MMCMNCRRAALASGANSRFLLLCCLSLSIISVGAAFLNVQNEKVSLESIVSANPPEVAHDGIKVLKPLNQKKCAGSGKMPTSFLESSPQASKESKASRQRSAFVCAAGCAAREPQLEESLAPWADFNTNSSGLEMVDSMEGFCNTQRESTDPFVMTVLWKGDVYLKSCKADHGLKTTSLYLIGPEDLSLVLVLLFGAQRIAHLPEGPIAFGMYLSDYSTLLDRHLVGPGLPIFGYLGRDTSWVVPWPSSFTFLSTLEVENWEQKHGAKTTGAEMQKTWESRDSKAYWIGAVTGPWEFALDNGLMAIPRLKLLKLSKEHPKLLNAEWSTTAGYGISWVKGDSNVSGFLAPRSRSVEEVTGIKKTNYQTVDDWPNSKYYVNLDGVVMGGRLTKLLSLGGVVLQHQAGYTEHVTALMKPYEHYVPIEYDLSDLVEKVQWLQQNDAEAKRIAANGKALAEKRMRFEDHLCYVWRALEGLGAKTASVPSDDKVVAQRLHDGKYQKVDLYETMRDTMEKFWGEKLEKIAVGDRQMSKRGITMLQWAWDRTKGIGQKAEKQL